MVLPEEDGGVPVDQKRFLIFQPSDDGLGNRLQALLSTVVLGMLSRRAIILDWIAMPQCNANFTDLFLPPEGLSWDLNTTLPNHKDLPAYKTKPEIWYPYCRNCALRSPITPESTWSTLLCEQDFGINTSQPIVQILSTQWFLPVIQHNPYWRSQLCEIFPEGGKNAFQVLAERLLKPSSAVQRQIDSVLDRIPDDATLIGLQVRRTENNAVGQGIEDAFLSCAAEAVKEEEVKATAAAKSEWRGIVAGSGSGFVRNRHARGVYKEDDADGERSPIVQQGRSLELDSSSLSSLIRHDQGASLSSTTTKPRFAYFLATDYRPTRAHFQNVLGDQLFVLENTFQTQRKSENPSSKTNKNAPGEPSNDRDDRLSIDIETYDDARQQSTTMASTASQSEAVARNSVRGVQTAVAEMFLLAQADRIISSPYSTFGYFAHAYSNVQPNIVKRDGTCIKRRSTQPCFQYWFGFANGGAQCSISSTVEMSEDYDCWL
ncbi:hypothetical protein BGX28_003797 [Mortierella sp. GBA30]|nr:hypothetical protein BGX28_003797 [Mortierella sp. GBA30]